MPEKKHDDAHTLKRSMKIREVTLGGHKTLFSVLKADEPVATLHFIKGFKSSPEYYADFMRDMADSGFNVVLVTLPDPGDDVDFMESYEDIMRAVCVDGALDKVAGGDNLPRVLGSHSTAGFIKSKFLLDPVDARKIASRYQGAVFAAPFYGNPLYRLKFIRPLTHAYSKAAGKIAVGTTWLERQFVRANDNDLSEGEKAIANHHQAVYMDGPTKAFMDDLQSGRRFYTEDAHAFPTKFMLADGDKVGFNSLSRAVAGQLNAEVVPVRGSHSEHRKTLEGRAMFAHLLHRVLKEGLSRKPRRTPGPWDYDFAMTGS